jgi:hypothetical protein
MTGTELKREIERAERNARKLRALEAENERATAAATEAAPTSRPSAAFPTHHQALRG